MTPFTQQGRWPTARQNHTNNFVSSTSKRHRAKPTYSFSFTWFEQAAGHRFSCARPGNVG